MNIPYYYNSGDDDDGVEIYTCLKCGDKIYVRSWYEPNFCPYCGVKYEGKKENIGNKNKYWHTVCFVENGYWALEKRTTEVWGEPSIENQWQEQGYYRLHNVDFKQILAEKKRREDDDEEDRKKENEDYLKAQQVRRERDPKWDESKAETESPFISYYEYRITRKKEVRRHSILVRKDKYREKTGKDFNEHEGRIPYGAKEEITTGIKFFNDISVNH